MAGLPKNRSALRAARIESGLELARICGCAHPDAAAASGRLDHDRIADSRGGSERCRHVRHRLRGPGGDWHADLLHQVPGVDLVAHLLRSTSGDGPIQVSPASITLAAKAAFSDRNP